MLGAGPARGAPLPRRLGQDQHRPPGGRRRASRADQDALALQHRQIPANLHFQQPNPDIPFEALGPVQTASRPAGGRPCAGVNSFGFGGSNAHLVLKSPPALPGTPPAASAAPQLLCLSARSEGGLKELRERYLALGPVPLPRLSYSSLVRRTQHPYRTAVVAEQLSDLETAAEHPAARQRPRVAFVYGGQGSQWLGMGRCLLKDPTFSAFVEECEPHYPWPLRDAFHQDSTSVDKTAIVQPMLFALQAGLTRMLAAWGVEPELVIGHSVGEVAAAWASGALDLADAIYLAVHRGRVMDRESSQGRMLAVSASAEAVSHYMVPGVGVAGRRCRARR